MGLTLTAEFLTRRDAEMSVEKLVQEHGIDRTQVFVAPVAAENSAGVEQAGSDLEEGRPDPDASPALQGLIEVSVDLEDDADAPAVEAAFRDYGAERMARR